MVTFKLVNKILLGLSLTVASVVNTSAQLDYTIGTGTTPNTCTTFPTPYGQYYEAARAQHLYTAAEMIAAGMGPGVITAIKFNVESLNLNNSCTYAAGIHAGYSIRMGTTTSGTLGNYVAGITIPVYGPGNYQPVLGLNTYPLATPFVWNGTDNIVLDICQGNGGCVGAPGGYTGNASVNLTNTSYASTYQYYTDCSGVLCATTSGSSANSRPNVIFTWAPPCQGVPVATVAGPDEVCPNKNFTLTLLPVMAGTTVQWQKSMDGTTWNNFTGTVTNGILTDNINVASWYRCIVYCTASGQSYTTPPKYITISKFYYCYCETSKATSSTGAADIGNVKVDKLPNGSVLMDNGAGTPTYSNAAANKAYTDFRRDPATPPVPIYADSSYRLYIRQINAGSTMVGTTAIAWLDYNHNGIFDPWEQFIFKNPVAAPLVPGQVLDTFGVSLDSFRYGLTGLRVVLRSGTVTDPADPCASYPDGETEDYLVEMRYNPCTGVPNAGRVEGDTSMCIGYGYVVTDTSYQKYAHGLSRTWEESGDGIAWFPVPNSTNKDTLMRTFMGQPTFYRVKMMCSFSGDSAYTAPFRVNVKPTYKCYCHSQSMGGYSDSSDIGAFMLSNFSVNDGGAHQLNPRAVRQRQDWTDLPEIEMDIDSSYQFYVYHTMTRLYHGDAKVTVFIDFNNNKQYDIPSERIYTGFTSLGYFTRLGTVTIPADVITDVPTGMRVILNNDVSPNVPSDEGCGEYVSGETEEYIVRFRRRLFPESVNDVNGIGSISLYPNPTSGKFTLSYNGEAGKVNVRVSSVTGQLLQERIIDNKGRSITEEFDLGGKASGVYFIEVEANGIKNTRRILLQ